MWLASVLTYGRKPFRFNANPGVGAIPTSHLQNNPGEHVLESLYLIPQFGMSNRCIEIEMYLTWSGCPTISTSMRDIASNSEA
jgi:hypothetical protein